MNGFVGWRTAKEDTNVGKGVVADQQANEPQIQIVDDRLVSVSTGNIS